MRKIMKIFDVYIEFINKIGLWQTIKYLIIVLGITLIYMRVFNGNKDLMCYILSAFKFKYVEEYDNKVWEKFRKEHEAKIDRYIGGLHSIEEKRSRTVRKKSKNDKESQDIDEQR